MHLRIILIVGLCSLAAAGQEPAPDISHFLKAGDAKYLEGNYEAAHESFDQARRLADESQADNPQRYDVLKRLSRVRAATGDFGGADSYLHMAISWRRTTQGDGDPKIAEDLVQSVAYRRGMKDYGGALATLNEVLGIHVKAGHETTDVADDFSRMAQIYMEQGKPELALGVLNNAISIRTKVSGPLHPSLVYDFDRLAEVNLKLRDYERAEAAYRRALVIRETMYGREHADLITTVDGLAYACFGQKKYDVAEPIYQRLIALWIVSVGNEHPALALALDKVAVFYADQKKYDHAKEATERATAIRAHFLADGLSAAATEQIAEGNLDAARALYARAIKVLDPPSPLYDELRSQVEGNLKNLDRRIPPAARPKKAKKK